MLLLWALLTCAYMQICPKYICSATPSTQSLCNILTEDPNGIPIFNLYNITCSLQDQYCNFSYELNNPDKCVAYSSKLPGERCYANAECRSQSCSMCHNVCIGLVTGSKCTLHDDCEIGLYCDADGTCKKWKVEGETCGNGVECASYLVCEANICIVAGSIKVGQPAFTPMSCESFFTYEVTPGNFQCISGPTLQSAQNCPNNNLCQYNLKLANGSVSSLSESCECSLDAQGTSYCQKGEGDYTKEINYVRIINSSYPT
jgi:hypothetical protein